MIVELLIPNCPESVFLVPDEEAEALRAKARNPGRVWSHEDVRKLAGTPVAEAQKIAEARMLFYASQLWTRPGKAERLAREAEQAVMGYEE